MDRTIRMMSLGLGSGRLGRHFATCWLAPLLAVLCLPAIVLAAPADNPGRTAPTQSPADRESWQIIYIGESRVGYTRATTSTVELEGRKIVRSLSRTHMTVKRFGQELKVATTLQTDETVSGELLSFVYTMENPPANSSQTTGVVQGTQLALTTNTGGREQTRTVPWDPQAKAPAYQDRLLADDPLQPGETREFKTFIPDFNRVTDVKIAADQVRPTRMHDGKRRDLLLAKITQSLIPAIVTRAWLDESGELLKSETSFLGSNLVTYTVDQAVALEELAGAELDLAVATLVRVEGAARLGHDSQQAVYQITTEDEDPLEFLLAGQTQEVERTGPHTARLTVTAVRPEERNRTVRTDAKYSQPSDFLQSDDFEVREHARKAKATELIPSRIALQMEKYVHERLTEKNFSTALASAAEVARSLEGDCTEHAVLLAAMLRAEGIASRIAVGMVFVEGQSVFGGHMWTEAFLGGAWIPLDATLGRGGIGAAHIKFAESAFSNDDPAPVLAFLPMLRVLGKLKIELVEAR